MFCNPQAAQLFPQAPDLAIDSGDVGEIDLLLRVAVGIQRHQFRVFTQGRVDVVKPDQGHEGLFSRCLRTDPGDGLVHDDGGIIAAQARVFPGLLHRDIAPVIVIQVDHAPLGFPEVRVKGRDHIAGGEPVVETRHARGHDMRTRPARVESAHMPFAEMAGNVALGLDRLGQGDLFLGQMRLIGGHGTADVDPPIVPAGQAGDPGRTADRCGGIETIEADTRPGHLVELGRQDLRMPVVRHVPPTLVVGQHEDDIRPGRGGVGDQADTEDQKAIPA